MEDDKKAAYLTSLSNDEFTTMSDEALACVELIDEVMPLYDEMRNREKKSEGFAVVLWRKLFPGAKAKAEAEYNNLKSKADALIKNTDALSLKELIKIEEKTTAQSYPDVPTDSPAFIRVVLYRVKKSILHKSLIAEEIGKRYNI